MSIMSWIRRRDTDDIRIDVTASDTPGHICLHIKMRDGVGVLAAQAGAFALSGISVISASVSTSSVGTAIDVFDVETTREVDWRALADLIGSLLASGPPDDVQPIEGTIEIVPDADARRSTVHVRAIDRAGLLHRVASAITRARCQIHEASVDTIDGVAVDRFSITGPTGGALDLHEEAALREAFAGVGGTRRRTARALSS